MLECGDIGHTWVQVIRDLIYSILWQIIPSTVVFTLRWLCRTFFFTFQGGGLAEQWHYHRFLGNLKRFRLILVLQGLVHRQALTMDQCLKLIGTNWVYAAAVFWIKVIYLGADHHFWVKTRFRILVESSFIWANQVWPRAILAPKNDKNKKCSD